MKGVLISFWTKLICETSPNILNQAFPKTYLLQFLVVDRCISAQLLLYTAFYSGAFFHDISEDYRFPNMFSRDYKTRQSSTWSRNREIKSPWIKDGLQFNVSQIWEHSIQITCGSFTYKPLCLGTIFVSQVIYVIITCGSFTYKPLCPWTIFVRQVAGFVHHNTVIVRGPGDMLAIAKMMKCIWKTLCPTSNFVWTRYHCDGVLLCNVCGICRLLLNSFYSLGLYFRINSQEHRNTEIKSSPIFI